MKLLCFDAEFANHQEILELSIWEATGNMWEESRQVFHQYVKPRTSRSWPGSQRVHHISPQMVANKPYFSKWRSAVQKLIDEADFLVGFDIGNDIEALRLEGVERLDSKPVVDVKDFHWMLHTLAQGVPLNARKGLQTTAEELGVPFSENLAHGADYDTRITLDCFRRLVGHYASNVEGRQGSEEIKNLETALVERYLSDWELTLDDYNREFARGWVYIQRWKDGYRVKALQAGPATGEDVVEQIPVAARYRALDEIDRQFDRRRDRRDTRTYHLTEADFRWFGKYANEYDGEEPLHKKMLELRQRQARE